MEFGIDKKELTPTLWLTHDVMTFTEAGYVSVAHT